MTDILTGVASSPPGPAAAEVPERLRRGLAVVIPAKNEAATIGELVRILVRDMGIRTIVVDDMSSDATARLAREAGAMVIPLASSLGAWGAAQTGLRHAVSLGCSRVVTMDADGQHPVSDIPRLLEAMLAEDADLVIGSCVDRGSRLRRIAWSLFRAVTAMQVGDLTSGFRVYGPRALALLVGRTASLIDYQCLGVLLMLAQAGLRVIETEVSMCPRISGHSRIFNTWMAVLEYMVFSCILSVSKTLHKLSPDHGK